MLLKQGGAALDGPLLLPRAAPAGIRVNAISPGPIDSGILETMNLSDEAADQFRAERTASNPMKRYGTVEEFAKAAAFLAFDATYTTGIELAVDGGETQL